VAFSPLAGLNGDQFEHALSQMSGEEATAFQTSMASSMSGFLGTLLDPSIGGRGGLADGGDHFAVAESGPYEKLADNSPDAPIKRSRQPSLTLWSSFRGVLNSTGADLSLGTHRTNASDVGGAVGFDYSPESFGGSLGLAIGLSDVAWDLASDTGKGHATSGNLGAYYSRKFGQAYFSAAFSYGFYNVTTDRTVVLGGTNTYEARFNARNIAGRFEFGRSFRVDEDLVTPYALFQVQDLGTPDYFESTIAGSPAYALSYTRKQHFDYLSEFGAGWSTIIGRNADALTDLHARLAWVHDYATGIDNTATFSSFSGASFTVHGAPPPRDAAHVKLGIEHDFDQLAFTLNAEGILSGTTQNYGGTAGLAYRW
jgi:uncharacterized protein with beta-barrel porin domain